MNINDVLQTLASTPLEAPVVFVTKHGEIGGGYHVTELKLAKITAIDCAARQAEWDEASIQLLDGDGGAHMAVGKFSKILAQSKRHVKGLGEADLHFEFAHDNAGLQQYQVQTLIMTNGRVEIHLTAQRAVCKPAQDHSSNCGSDRGSGCCAGETARNVGANDL